MTAANQVLQITIVVNGESRTIRSPASVTDLMADAETGNVAVARNREVVPRAEWDTTTLQEGDLIEIVRPVRGG